MLESVRQQPGRILYSAEPYEIAKSWKLPIFNVQQFQKILDKKLLPLKKNHGSSQVKVLKGHYIKLEGSSLRPEFCEFKSWPRINLRSTSGSPFDLPTKRKLRGATTTKTTAPGGVTGGGGGVVTTTVYGNDNANRSSRRERMTRKQQTSTDSDQHNGGYCEMCCQDYIDLAEHLASPGHLKLAADPSQFTALDKLIKETFHNNLNGDMCATLLTSPPHHNKRVLRSNKSPPSVAINNYNNETMGNKHTNSDKQIDSRQSTPAPLSPPIQNNLHQSSQNMTHNNMTNGHVTRSTTAGHRQSNCSSSSSSNHNNTITNVEHLHNDLMNKKALPQLPLLNEIQCNGLAVNHNHLTRLSVKTETSQQHHYQLQQSLSPTGSDTSNSHHLRSKKQLWLPTNLLGTTAEDEGNPIRIKNESKAMSPKSKRRKLRKKRLSVEEKLIEDNKSYYKVEVLNSKLRSTGYYMTQREIELNRLKTNDSSTTGNSNLTTDQTHSKIEDKEPVVVRFKKVRKSELSLLSDEAESFMFGEPARKDQDTDDDDDEDDDESSSDAEENSNDTNVNSNSSSSNHKSKEIKKEEMMDESSLGSCSSSSQSNMTKRKRRTHAEMFIHDNLDYYKFDIQGSRLRLHGGLLPSDQYKSDPDNIVDDISDKKVKMEDDCDEKCKINIFSIKNEEDGDSTDEISADQLTFSFESVPDLEPWYQTFKRQDECNEIYHPIYSDYPKIRLPYEYPGFERQKLLYSVRNKFRPFRRRKRRRFLKNVVDKPRKSPRCHASTLAILSSLKYRRKKDSPDKLKLLETPLRTIPQSVNEEQSNTPQLHEEESRSSTIEVSSVPDTSAIKIPEDTKITPELNMRDVSESIDLLFYQLYKDNFDNDKYVHVIKMLSRALENYDEDNIPLGSPSSSHSKGKHRSSKSSPKSSNNVNNNDSKSIFDINEWDMCLDVDPNIVNELETLTTTLTPGPEMDMALLLDNYKSCNSMERADYEHLHPRAIDALRACATDGSCNSSDCGGSSTCELLGFTEDGRMLSKKRKRKKRNMTGWPKDKPKKLVVKNNKDECSMKSELTSSNSIISDTNNKVNDNNVGNSTTSETTNNCNEDDHKTDLNNYKSVVNNDSVLEQSVCAKNKYPKVKLTRSLSRTGSVDSSTPLSDCNLCVVTGKIGSRQLRGHSNSVDIPSVVIKSSPIKRRASSPEKRPPGRGRRRRTCTATTRWSPWANRKGR